MANSSDEALPVADVLNTYAALSSVARTHQPSARFADASGEPAFSSPIARNKGSV